MAGPRPRLGAGNLAGKPLFSHEVVVNLIAGATTRTGLKIEAELDTNAYPKGIQVPMRNSKESKFKGRIFMANGITRSFRAHETCITYFLTVT